jgi:hypothetical protein
MKQLKDIPYVKQSEMDYIFLDKGDYYKVEVVEQIRTKQYGRKIVTARVKVLEQQPGDNFEGQIRSLPPRGPLPRIVECIRKGDIIEIRRLGVNKEYDCHNPKSGVYADNYEIWINGESYAFLSNPIVKKFKNKRLLLTPEGLEYIEKTENPKQTTKILLNEFKGIHSLKVDPLLIEETLTKFNSPTKKELVTSEDLIDSYGGVEFLRECKQRGFNIRYIADRLGINTGSISQYLQKKGIYGFKDLEVNRKNRKSIMKLAPWKQSVEYHNIIAKFQTKN